MKGIAAQEDSGSEAATAATKKRPGAVAATAVASRGFRQRRRRQPLHCGNKDREKQQRNEQRHNASTNSHCSDIGWPLYFALLDPAAALRSA